MAAKPFPNNVKVTPTPLEIMTIDGFPGGMNVAVPPHEIGDNQARYIQDAFVSTKTGETPRRGPVAAVAGLPSFSSASIVGMIQTLDPQGNLRLGVVKVSGSNLQVDLLNAAFTTVSATITLDSSGNFTTSPYPIVDAKPTLTGGTAIGVSTSDYANASAQLLAFWNGGINANYTTGTISTTYGSKTVTGSGTSWAANVSPGMYLMDSSNVLIGMVAIVNSNTSLTLEGYPYNQVSGASYTLQSLRGFAPRVVEGTITVGTSSTSVAGGATFFLDGGLGSGWKIFRMLDGAYVGTVSSVTSNVALTLGANAAVAMSEDEFYAINGSGDYGFSLTDTTKKRTGFLNASYQGRQFYANRAIPSDAGGDWVNRIWFSETTDPEDVMMAQVDGNFIPITSGSGVNTPIKQIEAAYNSLLILKERETFFLTGADESQWVIRKLADDGTLSAMSVVPYQGGVLWAGRDGIYYYDGVEANNIVDTNLGLYYQQLVRQFDPSSHRMYGAVVRDHYFLFIESIEPTVPVIKGYTSSTPTQYTICIYLPTLSVVTLRNVNFRGYVNPSTTQGQIAWFGCNTSAPHGYIADFNALFDSTGNDSITCDGGAAGPDFYIESKRYSVGNGLLLKNWKYLLLNYLVGGDTLKTDTITGLNDIGETDTNGWAITQYTWTSLGVAIATWNGLGQAFPTWNSVSSNIYSTAKMSFLRRDRYFGFRLYQTSSSVTTASIAAFAIAYKLGRVGRI